MQSISRRFLWPCGICQCGIWTSSKVGRKTGILILPLILFFFFVCVLPPPFLNSLPGWSSTASFFILHNDLKEESENYWINNYNYFYTTIHRFLYHIVRFNCINLYHLYNGNIYPGYWSTRTMIQECSVNWYFNVVFTGHIMFTVIVKWKP